MLNYVFFYTPSYSNKVLQTAVILRRNLVQSMAHAGVEKILEMAGKHARAVARRSYRLGCLHSEATDRLGLCCNKDTCWGIQQWRNIKVLFSLGDRRQSTRLGSVGF